MPLIGVPQGQHNWWTEGCRRALGAQKQTEELGWRLGNCEEGSSDLAPIPAQPQEGRKVKPIPPQPAAARRTSRTDLTGLKPAGGILNFFFLLPFFLSF